MLSYPKRIIEQASNAPLSPPLESVTSSPTILSLNSTPTSSSHRQCSTSTGMPQVLISQELKPYSPFQDPSQHSPNPAMLHSTPLESIHASHVITSPRFHIEPPSPQQCSTSRHTPRLHGSNHLKPSRSPSHPALPSTLPNPT
jgi:hypothetical protein